MTATLSPIRAPLPPVTTRPRPSLKTKPQSRPLLEKVQALGWGVLAEEPGREIILGAVTQPWVANVRFEGLAPDQFAGFEGPGYVKIAWTLSAEPIDARSSMVRTETRVATTDKHARERFRRYWAVISPGVRLIRVESLRLVRADAERRYRAASVQPTAEEASRRASYVVF